MITLGGNIKLEGFDDLEPGKLIVVKKMVGLFAKKVSEKIGELDSFEVTKAEDSVSVKAVSKEKTLEEKAADKNLFVAISKALMGIEEKAKQ